MTYYFGVVLLGRQHMKRMFLTITLAAAAWILAIPATAQGRSQSHPGRGSAAAGSMGGGHGMDASGTSGPHTPGQLLTQNTQTGMTVPSKGSNLGRAIQT